MIFLSFLIGLYGWYGLTTAMRFKTQIMINLKYAETPWWYISVLEMNRFFEEKDFVEKPILVTAVPPHLVDFYSNGKYQLLPLSNQQDFNGDAKNVWGDYDYDNLFGVYENQIRTGKELYLANYGLGHVGHLNAAFKNMQEQFQLEKLQSGCYELCNIYKVSLKE